MAVPLGMPKTPDGQPQGAVPTIGEAEFETSKSVIPDRAGYNYFCQRVLDSVDVHAKCVSNRRGEVGSLSPSLSSQLILARTSICEQRIGGPNPYEGICLGIALDWPAAMKCQQNLEIRCRSDLLIATANAQRGGRCPAYGETEFLARVH